jgi:hypothetical protein
MKTQLTEIRKARIKVLVTNGGFSVRAIAERVFGVAITEESEEAKALRHSISAYMHREKIKLGDWRNCNSILSKHHAKTVVNTVNQSRKQKRWRKKVA